MIENLPRNPSVSESEERLRLSDATPAECLQGAPSPLSIVEYSDQSRASFGQTEKENMGVLSFSSFLKHCDRSRKAIFYNRLIQTSTYVQIKCINLAGIPSLLNVY